MHISQSEYVAAQALLEKLVSAMAQHPENAEPNLRFAGAVEPANAALADYTAACRALRSQGLPTLPSTIALENATNPFLRCTQPEIIRNLQRRGLTDTTELGVFTALREWKNRF